MQEVQAEQGGTGFRFWLRAGIVPGVLCAALLGCSTGSTGSESNQSASMPAGTDLVSDPTLAESYISFADIESPAVPPLKILYYQAASGEATVQLRYAVRGSQSGGGLLLHLIVAYGDEAATLDLESNSVILEMVVGDEQWRAESGVLDIGEIASGSLKLSLQDVVLTRMGSEPMGTMGPLSGTISGQVTRSCHPLPAGYHHDPTQPLPERHADEEWASEFCAPFAY